MIHLSTVLRSIDIDAVAPNDYSSIHIDVNFEANQLETIERVTIVNDKRIEGPECFLLTLIEPSGAYGIEIGSPGVATVAIKDDDCKIIKDYVFDNTL